MSAVAAMLSVIASEMPEILAPLTGAIETPEPEPKETETVKETQ